ncbi:MAG: hypothetical protein WBQ41_09725 [Solirubrobacterales bacterium]
MDTRFNGPSLFMGAILLALAIAPAILIHVQPWKGIAVGNAIAQFVLGFLWSTAPVITGPEGFLRNAGLQVWYLTIPVSLVLLAASFFL